MSRYTSESEEEQARLAKVLDARPGRFRISAREYPAVLPHELFVLLPELNGDQLKILLLIAARLYNPPSVAMRLNVEGLAVESGLSEAKVARAVAQLVRRGALWRKLAYVGLGDDLGLSPDIVGRR